MKAPVLPIKVTSVTRPNVVIAERHRGTLLDGFGGGGMDAPVAGVVRSRREARIGNLDAATLRMLRAIIKISKRIMHKKRILAKESHGGSGGGGDGEKIDVVRVKGVKKRVGPCKFA